MMDDGLRTRTKIGNLPLGGGVDLEGGSPRKNHGLGHNFGASLSSHQASKMFWSIRVLVTDQFSVNTDQELEGPFFKALTNNLLIGGAIFSFILFCTAGLERHSNEPDRSG